MGPQRGRGSIHIGHEFGGAISEGAFFDRHRGAGPYWAMIEQLFEVSRRKAGLSMLCDETVPATFRRPGVEHATLF